MIRHAWMIHSSLALAFVIALQLAAQHCEAAKFSLEKTNHGVTVKLDGKVLTEYLIDNGPKPILWPVYGPTGAEMTRDYPMKKVDGEKHDHWHQRSLWFTHGEVNGIDFWAEEQSYDPGKKPADKRIGTVKHREFRKLAEGDNEAVIETVNDWLSPEGKKQLEDVRTLRFSTDGDARLLDYDVTLTASAGDVTFGDTKEGVMAIRVPTVMDVKQEKGKQGGQIVNSEGQTDDAAWGKRARWVDYHGQVEGQLVGVAILNHPSSFRHPAYWHVRTYGLFASNPFGLHDFEPKSGATGAYTLTSGQSLVMRHRFIFHSGDEKAAKVAEAFEKYAAEKK